MGGCSRQTHFYAAAAPPGLLFDSPHTSPLSGDLNPMTLMLLFPSQLPFNFFSIHDSTHRSLTLSFSRLNQPPFPLPSAPLSAEPNDHHTLLPCSQVSATISSPCNLTLSLLSRPQPSALIHSSQSLLLRTHLHQTRHPHFPPSLQSSPGHQPTEEKRRTD